MRGLQPGLAQAETVWAGGVLVELVGSPWRPLSPLAACLLNAAGPVPCGHLWGSPAKHWCYRVVLRGLLEGSLLGFSAQLDGWRI